MNRLVIAAAMPILAVVLGGAQCTTAGDLAERAVQKGIQDVGAQLVISNNAAFISALENIDPERVDLVAVDNVKRLLDAAQSLAEAGMLSGMVQLEARLLMRDLEKERDQRDVLAELVAERDAIIERLRAAQE